MNEGERLAAPNGRRRVEDHFVEITEMIGTMPVRLPPGVSIKKVESQRRKQRKTLKRPPSEMDTTGDVHEESRG